MFCGCYMGHMALFVEARRKVMTPSVSQDMVIPIWNWKVMFNSLLYKGRFTSALQTRQVSFSTIRLGTHGAHGTVVLRVWTRASGCTLSTRLYFDQLCTLGHPWCSPALGRTVTTRHPPHLSLNNELFFAQHQEDHLGRGCLCFYPFSPSLAYSLAYSKLGCKALSQIVDKKIHPLF